MKSKDHIAKGTLIVSIIDSDDMSIGDKASKILCSY